MDDKSSKKLDQEIDGHENKRRGIHKYYQKMVPRGWCERNITAFGDEQDEPI